MSRIAPTDYGTLVRIFIADGFTVSREKASHIVLTKPGVPRPVIIPKYSECGLDIIHGNMRTAGMSRERYLALLSGN